MAEALVVVGVVLGAFGVKGEVRIKPFTAAPETIAAYGPLCAANGKPLFEIRRFRMIKDGLAAFTAPPLTREAAEAMKGALLHVPRAALPAPDPDDFYIVDLIGCLAERIDGRVLGRVHAVHDFGAGDILEVRGEAGSTFFPFTRAVVPTVDLAGRRLVIDPPPEALIVEADPSD